MRNTSPEPLRSQTAPSPNAEGRGLAPTEIVAMILPADGRVAVGVNAKITVGTAVDASVGSGASVGATCAVVAGTQAENNTLTNINIEASNLRVFIFSPLGFG